MVSSPANWVHVKRGGRNSEKVHPSESPRESPETPSPSFGGESIQSDNLARYLESRDSGYSPLPVTSRSMTSFSAHPSLVSDRHSPSSCKSVGSSPLESPSRIDFASYRVGHSVQQEQEGSPLSQNDRPFDQETVSFIRMPDKGTGDPKNTDDYSDDVSMLQNQCDKSKKPLDFESDGCIWFPPPLRMKMMRQRVVSLHMMMTMMILGTLGALFSSTSSLSRMFPSKEKQNEVNKEPLRAVIQGHFRALVSQLLHGEGIKVSNDGGEDWLDIVTTIAWQAANFVKPDTSRGGSMDPGNYVKVKCIASGSPSDRLLLLGGALEYQSVVNQLASFNTLVQQENDHLKMIMSKIEALRPNVLLVEKSVSPYAQEYLLAKEISLVLNVKRPLLERIARCIGAFISPSIDNISTTRLGHCELFRVERVSEEHETVNQFNKKPSKTLMFLKDVQGV
ncbi:hypothetical protein GH714_005904 [Hevea brasiliensis]|uniref:Uncharacterized protein n=1 Tax=Hevea brasiliensis TaxID=3981 RepID=A0A6A6NFV6_HEVBR|nr:hypothetical protein GH714_005904 [Hevea brasiliensis]